jgi:TatD DNase family protein
MIIDSHCHLDFPEFEAERDAVVARARAAGVERMITIATRVSRHDAYRAIAEHYDDVFFTAGTHPLQAGEEPDTPTATFVALARHPKCVAIGEAGLDYHYDPVPRDVAARVFRTQIAAARLSGLPLVIHAREADDDMAAILRDEMGQGRFAAVLHCFTAGAALARAGLDLGLYVSFSGVVTFKTSEDLRTVARMVPLERMLVETDAPFLSPVPLRGKRNEPANAIHTARVLADLKGVDLPAFGVATNANVLRLFKKMPPLAGSAVA